MGNLPHSGEERHSYTFCHIFFSFVKMFIARDLLNFVKVGEGTCWIELVDQFEPHILIPVGRHVIKKKFASNFLQHSPAMPHASGMSQLTVWVVWVSLRNNGHMFLLLSTMAFFPLFSACRSEGKSKNNKIKNITFLRYVGVMSWSLKGPFCRKW